jgi:hypothetical protein
MKTPTETSISGLSGRKSAMTAFTPVYMRLYVKPVSSTNDFQKATTPAGLLVLYICKYLYMYMYMYSHTYIYKSVEDSN